MSDIDLSKKAERREDRKRELQKTCEECKLKEAIYQCPRCNIRTCSLECVRQHKVRTECNGKRNRAPFLPLCHMSDSSLRSDYFFLEEVLDRMPNKNSSKRVKTQHQTRGRNCRRLLQQCEKRNICLKLMPNMMERHKKNNSWYCVKRDVIMWKVEVIIVHPSSTSTSFSFQMSEDDAEILTRIQKQAAGGKSNSTILVVVDDTMRLFVKKLPAPTNQQKYVEIDPIIDNLKSFLSGMTIIEHPTIYCVDKDSIGDFPTGTEKIKELSAGADIDPSTAGSGVVSDMKMDISNDISTSNPTNVDVMMNQEPNGKGKMIVKSEDSDLMKEVSSTRLKAMVEDNGKPDMVKPEMGMAL